MINLKINDTVLDVKEGMTILNAAASAGIYIPTLCYHKDLSPFGGCRFCAVEVSGARLPMTACNTPVAPQMRVLTDSPTVIRYRRAILRILLANYYDAGYKRHNEKFVIDEDNELIRFAKQYDVDVASAMAKHPRYLVDSDPNPFVWVDRNKCIQCLRCVRACAEIQGRFVWSQSYRGYKARIVAGDDSTMLASRCESCGACVVYCPTGALDNKMSVHKGRADKLVRTTCTYCGVGCQLDLNVKDGKVIRVTSNRDDDSFNGMHLCVKGRYGYEFIHHPRRHAKPRVREYLLKNEPRPAERGKFVDVDWDTALDIVAKKLKQIRDDGAQIGTLASGRLLNEESYLVSKFARQALGTNNVDIASNLYSRNEADGLLDSLGLPAMSNSFDDVAADAQAFFVIGSNLTEQHPVFGARIRQNVLRRRVKMVVASPDFFNIEEYAALSLRHQRGAEAALVNGLMHIILEKGWENQDALRKYPNGFKEAKAMIDGYAPTRVSELTGVPADQLYAAAEILASNRPAAVLWGMGISNPEATRALANLQLLLGNLDQAGGGVNPLRAQNNSQGASDMGCAPGFLPGYQPVSDANARGRFESAWGSPIRAEAGMNALRMIQAAGEGRVRALYIVGEDILTTSPEAAEFRADLEVCEFVVLQEMAASETTRYADVILPDVSFAEKTGTFTSAERRVQMVRQAIEPIGEARPDWQILAGLGGRLALGWDYATPAQIMDEIAALTPIYAGVSHDRLQRGERLQWPVESKAHNGAPILPIGSFGEVSWAVG
ncbi:MAG: formate dehydrogenase subunit alpha [Anaerolineaceae bacterium]|nr:2Fe-2S iron-sulfur cluster binding domain-containing protein [Anaerolineae bacterium AMX1]WKZ53351.1 MAG: molybdopterin-dependent oxidoreductase [Anaerolineales bacterium]GIK08496.1 MAG: formate dehydrogenase subunit alpha [Chloroflexota bacterium]GJQ38354.1 MAG: formate dehydrogenase subunit alpha [Anaerolineaceae bacterium]HPP62408.1 molybdopterin-dependent oxidoreductase [Anaerolineales bacterium]